MWWIEYRAAGDRTPERILVIAGRGRHIASFLVDQVREIARAVFGGGSGGRCGVNDFRLAVLLPAPEEEGLIGAIVEFRNSYGTAERETPIVLPYFVAQAGIGWVRLTCHPY